MNNLITYYKDAATHTLPFDVSQLYDNTEPQTSIFQNVVYFAAGITANSQCSQKINGYDGQGRPIYGSYANSSSCWKFIPKVCTDTSDISTCVAPTTTEQKELQDEYIPMDYVNSFDFYSPGQWPFDNNNILPKVYTTVATIQNNHPAKGLIAEGLSALFSAGLLPVATDSSIYNKAISKSSVSTLVADNPDILYQPNSTNGTIETNGPWFSQYSKVIHSVCFDNATKLSCTVSTLKKDKKFPIVYTFAFDDFLAQDGTLTSTNTTVGKSISITINDMTGYPKTTPGTPPTPAISVDTPKVLSGTLLSCTGPRPSTSCSISALFSTKNTPDEILKSYIVTVAPQSFGNGDNCQRTTSSVWNKCGGVTPTSISDVKVEKHSGPTSEGVYTYKVTASVLRTQLESGATGAIWKHCSGSTTNNKFKYLVTVAENSTSTPIGAMSPNSTTYQDVAGCAAPLS
jgi:hypothetical protein